MKKVFFVLFVIAFFSFFNKIEAKVMSGGGSSTSCKGSSGICMVVENTEHGTITYYGKFFVNL